MTTSTNLDRLAGKTMKGVTGHKIGKIVDVYESTAGEQGTFVTVATGLFGTHASFVPLRDADLSGDDVVVPYDKDLVKDAPRVATDEELTSEEEERLYQHYSLLDAAGAEPRGTEAVGAVGHDTSGPTTDSAMTRSEERLSVGTEEVEVGRARLRKRILTETETRTVPVSHEEVRIERESIAPGDAAAVTGAQIGEMEAEVVLHEEVPVVTKEAVPVERVRVGKETVTEQETVREQVRKEKVELDGDSRSVR